MYERDAGRVHKSINKHVRHRTWIFYTSLRAELLTSNFVRNTQIRKNMRKSLHVIKENNYRMYWYSYIDNITSRCVLLASNKYKTKKTYVTVHLLESKPYWVYMYQYAPLYEFYNWFCIKLKIFLKMMNFEM